MANGEGELHTTGDQLGEKNKDRRKHKWGSAIYVGLFFRFLEESFFEIAFVFCSLKSFYTKISVQSFYKKKK